MKTKSFVIGAEGSNVEVGETYCLGELWDGNGDVDNILDVESGCGSVGDCETDEVAEFDIVKLDDDPLFTEVKVTGIY